MTTNPYTQPNAAHYLLKGIKAEGVDHAFLVPGYMVEPFLSAFEEAGIEPTIACQEGGAAYMADGYARASLKFGVAMGIGGPGVSNMVTAVGAAYSDRSPVLVLAGNTPDNLEGVGSFQDSGPTGVADRDLFLPLTTFAEVIPDKSLVGSFLRKAIKAMKGFQNQPAFLSIPHDMQLTELPYDYEPIEIVEAPRILDTDAAAGARDIIDNAKHIAVLAGNGCVWSEATEELAKFADQYSVPVTTSMRAKGVLPEDNPHSMGIYGVGGSLWGNQVVMGHSENDINASDVLLILGCTLNENNTHGWLPDFHKNKKIVRVDINPNNILGKEYDEHFVTGDVRTFLRWLMHEQGNFGATLGKSIGARKSWLGAVRETPYWDAEAERTSDATPIEPARAIADLRAVAPRDTVMVVDSGAHTFFTSHNWESYAPNEFIVLTTTGPMGYGVAATIGAKRARPDQPHCVVVGDGSLLMHGMEIHTAARYKIPMVIVVINNSALANVYLRTLKESKEAQVLSSLPTQDWAAFAKSLGGDGVVVEDPKDLKAAYEKGFACTDKPFLIDVRCNKMTPTPNTMEAAAPG